ncbi:hypothetical protein AB7281_14805 [Providencia rettgeri]
MANETNDRISSWEERRKQFSGSSQVNQSQEPQVQPNSWEEKRRQFLETNQQPQLSDAQMANLDIPTDEILAYHNTQKPQQKPEIGDPVVEAGKGLLQTGANVVNIVPEISDAISSFGAWAGQAIGGDGTYQPAPRLQLPDDMKPQDKYAMLGAEIGPYLIPLIGPERTAAVLSQAANASKAERAAVRGADMVAENTVGALAQNSDKDNAGSLTTDLGVGVAGSGIARAAAPLLKGAYNTVANKFSKAGQQAAEDTATQAKKAADAVEPEVSDSAQQYANAAFSGKESRIAQVINDIQPDQNVVDAMRRLDINPDEMLEAYVSGSDAFKAVQIGLASQDESVLAAIKRESMEAISSRAAKIIDDAGAMPDRLAMDTKFKGDFNRARDALKAQENELYKPINQSISSRTEVMPENTRAYLDNLSDDLGGSQYLSPIEKKVYEMISPTTDKAGAPTYARLNAARSIVGAELSKSRTPFGSSEERNLGELYSMLSRDRDDVAKSFGFGDEVKAANALTAQRKMMEGRVYDLLGKDLSGDISATTKTALDGLQSGNTKAFNRLLASIPDKNVRAELIVTGLRDMFRKGTKTEIENNVNGFVKFYADLKRNGTDRLLTRDLPPATVRELNDYYTVARNVASANRFYISTGKLNGFLSKFEKQGGLLDKVAKYGKMSAISAVLGHVPVVGSVLNTAVAAHMGAKAATQESGSTAVQKMMASSVWKRMVSAARGNPTPAAQERIVANAEREIQKSSWWNEFYRTLPKEEKERITRLGIIGWFSGEEEGQ